MCFLHFLFFNYFELARKASCQKNHGFCSYSFQFAYAIGSMLATVIDL